mgnify:CR=1 FL=1
MTSPYGRTHSHSRLTIWLAAVPTVFVGIFVVGPAANIFISSIKADSLQLLTSNSIRNVLWFTSWQATLSTILVLVLAVPLAFLIANFKFAYQRIFLSLISVPFLLPSIVVGLAFLQILPRNTHRTAFALIMAHVYFNFGFAVRLVGGRWLQIHPHLDDAARTLGASPTKLFTTVTFPMLKKALINAGCIVFTLCFTSYGVVRVLGGPSRSTLETEIYFRAMQLGDVSGAVLLSAIQVVAIVALFYITTKATSQTSEQISPPTISRQKTLHNSAHKTFVTLAIWLVTALAIVPLIAVATRSMLIDSRFTLFAWRQVFDDPEILGSLGKTLFNATLATAFSTSLALLGACTIAYGQTRSRFFSIITTLPIVISAVSVGLGMIITFDTGWFDWRGAQIMLPIAHAMVALPLAIRMISPVLEAIPNSLREASSLLGASHWSTWRKIDLKIIKRATLSAAVISAAVSIGEFGASSFLARRGTETLPVTISRLLSRPGETMQAQAFVLATVLALASIGFIFFIDSISFDRKSGRVDA